MSEYKKRKITIFERNREEKGGEWIGLENYGNKKGERISCI